MSSSAVWAVNMFRPACFTQVYWQVAIFTLRDRLRTLVVLGFGHLHSRELSTGGIVTQGLWGLNLIVSHEHNSVPITLCMFGGEICREGQAGTCRCKLCNSALMNARLFFLKGKIHILNHDLQ